MKKYLLFFLTFIGLLPALKGQEVIDVMRYEYQVTFRPSIKDSLHVKEKVFLDVWNNNSRFYSEDRAKLIDFLAEDKNVHFRSEMVYPSDVKAGNMNWTVVKESDKVFLVFKVGSTIIKTEDKLASIEWSILDGNELYEGLTVQKAVGNWKGRNWSVWFTQDIPLIEGPYKFKNLPGFVVKAVDDNEEYLFEFIEARKEKITANYFGYDNALLANEKELSRIRKVALSKTLKMVLEEKGIIVNTKDNPDLEASLNEKVEDNYNHIEIL